MTNNLPPEKTHVILRAMNEALRYRGPDDEGYHIDKDIALGHRRLSIIDLAGGHQPLYNEDKSLVLIFNGEIYNFQGIREYCIKKGHTFSTHTDSEVILHLYEEKGTELLADLNGMFAFALWNIRTKELFLARDRYGKKPIYYATVQNQFIFASELKSLFQYPFLERTLDHAAVAKFLSINCIPAPRTPFNEIKQIPGGHYIMWHAGNYTVHQYWDNDFRPQDITHYPHLKKRETVYHLFMESVRRRMISEVPLGIFLSGGIDSSSIVGCMRFLNPTQEIKTFNVGYDESSFDESSFAELVAKHFHTNHHTFRFNSQDLIKLLPEIIDYIDTPIGDPSLLPGYLLCKRAREWVTVALIGDGSDELMAGYPTYFAYSLAQWYKRIPLFLREGLIERCISSLPVSHSYQPIDYKMKHFIKGVKTDKLFYIQRWIGAFNSYELTRLLTSARETPLTDPILYDENEYYLRNDERFPHEIDKVYQFHLKLYLQEMLIAKVDRMSMAHSLELRAPFLDVNFAEAMNALAHREKSFFFKGKRIFRETFEDLLPQKILKRKKRGFGVPIGKWIKKDLAPLYQEIFSDDTIRRNGLFNQKEIRRLINEHTHNICDHRNRLWALLMFQLWYDRWK